MAQYQQCKLQKQRQYPIDVIFNIGHLNHAVNKNTQ